jgi:hypothetical protein
MVAIMVGGAVMSQNLGTIFVPRNTTRDLVVISLTYPLI